MVNTSTRHLSSPGLTLERVPFCAGTWPHGPHAPNTSGIWGLSSLTVRQIGAFCGDVWVLGLGTGNAQKPGYSHTGAFWRTRDNKLEGRKWQEAYLLHFLAK
jgi:hypothetical protein